MSIFGSLSDEGRAARRGLLVLFGFTGFMLVKGWSTYERDYLRLALGIASLVIFIGLWRNWRWARWLAMGACFLSVIVAFAMPVILELWRPFDAYLEQSAGQAYLFTGASAAAIGFVAYKGLGYLRSTAACKSFSNNQQQYDALARENSAGVVVSAGCIALFLGMAAIARGVGGAQVSALSDLAARTDLVVNSLCLSGQNLVKAEVQNRGTGTSTSQFALTFSDLRGFDSVHRSWGTVPLPGQNTYVALDNAINQEEREGVRKIIRVEVDSGVDIRESNENNNTATFEIVYHSFYPENLPRCP